MDDGRKIVVQIKLCIDSQDDKNEDKIEENNAKTGIYICDKWHKYVLLIKYSGGKLGYIC